MRPRNSRQIWGNYSESSTARKKEAKYEGEVRQYWIGDTAEETTLNIIRIPEFYTADQRREFFNQKMENIFELMKAPIFRSKKANKL